MAGLYIHIPFCKSFCAYCDFYSVTDTTMAGRLVDAIISESALRAGYLEGEGVETIYFGGGTPSLLGVPDIRRILSELANHFAISDNPEVTLEANPDDLNKKYLDELMLSGVNRLSLGVQSWNDSRLKFLGRRHTAEQSAAALEEAARAGFDNISADLIYGIPGMALSDLRHDLEMTFSYPVKHLSAYHLTIEEGTRFGKMKKEGRLSEADEEASASMFSLLGNECRTHGLIHYEISNFAKEGFISRHNSSYWKQIPYLGLGPSAHSFDRRSRQWNVSNLKKYIKSVEEGAVMCEREELDRITVFNEYLMTSLRTMWGVELDHVEQQFDKELRDYLVNLSDKYIRYGLMQRNKNTLVLTDQGKMISDNIIGELLMEL
ncbi:MAG: radical SAM family heme chaperone HemW [Bacteroidia bacterium]|nr:MAG: radical SAM family heme chaperone HemW [Bacteroidia bacterium]